MEITLQKARKTALHAQLLTAGHSLSRGKKGVLQVINHLGYVQIDTISVVNRAHHHVLWSRVPGYKQDHLNRLLAIDKDIFEYWSHAASFLPMSDFRFYLPLKKRFLKKSSWTRNRVKKYGKHMKEVLQRITEHGALSSKDFENVEKRGTWWDWKPAKIALELLFWNGDLMVAERRNFQKVYDLNERVLNKSIDQKIPSEQETADFVLDRAFRSLGIASEKALLKYIPVTPKKFRQNALARMIKKGMIQPVCVKGLNGSFFANNEFLEQAIASRLSQKVHILSPFDNLVINRERLKRLFDFNYTIECYVPEKKRKYGYFSLPVLYRDRFIARLDAKADRKTGILNIKNLYFEDWFKPSEQSIKALSRAIHDFADFCGCNRIAIFNVTPGKFKKSVSREVI